MDVTNENTQVIPKIIHYCWFGGKDIPLDQQQCMQSWNMLKGYKIMRWDESNCTFDESNFIREMHKEKKWCYVADYYRLKVLYEYGGVYFDTDAKVFRTIDDLLKHKFFISFLYNCSVGGGIIGAIPRHPLIGEFLSMYDRTVFRKNPSGKVFEEKDGILYSDHLTTCNYYYTYYILKHYPNFRLNNKYQDMGDFVIYPKELFEIGTISKKHYVIHYCAGAWWKDAENSNPKTFKEKIKHIIAHMPRVYNFVQIIVRKFRYYRKNKNIPFYEYSIAQKKRKQLPEL